MATVLPPPPSPRTTAPLDDTLRYERLPQDPSKPLAFRYIPRPGLADLCPTEVFTPQLPRRRAYQFPRYRHVDNDSWILLQVDGACSKNGQEHAKGGYGVVYGPRLQKAPARLVGSSKESFGRVTAPS